MVGIRSWFFWPLVLLALCLLTLCVVVAVSLFRQQATLAEAFRENVSSRKAAGELEECLTDLIALEKEHVETVAPMHERVHEHLQAITKCSGPATRARALREDQEGVHALPPDVAYAPATERFWARSGISGRDPLPQLRAS